MRHKFVLMRHRLSLMRNPTFREFPAFSRAFMPRPPLVIGAYMYLPNLTLEPVAAVRVVADCVDRAKDSRAQVGALLRSDRQWRFHVLGCVGCLVMEPDDRPMDDLWDAACRESWVSPQLLATLSLVGEPDWSTRIEPRLVDLGDPKAAAALRGLVPDTGPELAEIASRDIDSGDDIARQWREDIRTAFDEAGLAHSW